MIYEKFKFKGYFKESPFKGYLETLYTRLVTKIVIIFFKVGTIVQHIFIAYLRKRCISV